MHATSSTRHSFYVSDALGEGALAVVGSLHELRLSLSRRPEQRRDEPPLVAMVGLPARGAPWGFVAYWVLFGGGGRRDVAVGALVRSDAERRPGRGSQLRILRVLRRQRGAYELRHARRVPALHLLDGRARRRERQSWPHVLCGALLGLCSFGGYPAMLFFAGFLLAAWLVMRVLAGSLGDPAVAKAIRLRRVALTLTIAAAILIIVALPSLFAFFREGQGYTDRTGMLSYELVNFNNALTVQSLFSSSIRELSIVAAPALETDVSMANAYVGAVALPLAVLWLIGERADGRRIWWFVVSSGLPPHLARRQRRMCGSSSTTFCRRRASCVTAARCACSGCSRSHSPPASACRRWRPEARCARRLGGTWRYGRSARSSPRSASQRLSRTSCAAGAERFAVPRAGAQHRRCDDRRAARARLAAMADPRHGGDDRDRHVGARAQQRVDRLASRWRACSKSRRCISAERAGLSAPSPRLAPLAFGYFNAQQIVKRLDRARIYADDVARVRRYLGAKSLRSAARISVGVAVTRRRADRCACDGAANPRRHGRRRSHACVRRRITQASPRNPGKDRGSYGRVALRPACARAREMDVVVEDSEPALLVTTDARQRAGECRSTQPRRKSSRRTCSFAASGCPQARTPWCGPMSRSRSSFSSATALVVLFTVLASGAWLVRRSRKEEATS